MARCLLLRPLIEERCLHLRLLECRLGADGAPRFDVCCFCLLAAGVVEMAWISVKECCGIIVLDVYDEYCCEIR